MKAKYIEIKDYLSNLIANGDDGDILPSEHQLCKYMNVSRVTARRAIGELENDGLIKRQKGKGAFINKKSHNKNTLNILLGIPEKLEIGENPITGCINSIIDRDIGLHIFNTRNDISKTFERIVKYDIDGIVGVRPNELDYPVYEELRKRGYPVLLIDRIIKNSHYNYVSTDYLKNGFRATEFLIKKGHRKILFVGVSNQLHFGEHMHKGYISAFTRHGIAISPELTYHFPNNIQLDNFFPEITENFINGVGNLDFSAVVVASGGLFNKTVLPAFKTHGIRIPEDVEVVVSDQVSENCLAKKYVHEMIQPNNEVGMRAIEEIEKIGKGIKGKVRVLIPSKFIIKQ